MKIVTYLMILALTSSFAFRGDSEGETHHSSRDKVEAPASQQK